MLAVEWSNVAEVHPPCLCAMAVVIDSVQRQATLGKQETMKCMVPHLMSLKMA